MHCASLNSRPGITDSKLRKEMEFELMNVMMKRDRLKLGMLRG